jgi:hypothetical protein
MGTETPSRVRPHQEVLRGAAQLQTETDGKNLPVITVQCSRVRRKRAGERRCKAAKVRDKEVRLVWYDRRMAAGEAGEGGRGFVTQGQGA